MFCSLCLRIVKIRKNQNKSFYADLCNHCQKKYLKDKKVKIASSETGNL